MDDPGSQTPKGSHPYSETNYTKVDSLAGAVKNIAPGREKKKLRPVGGSQRA
jgi:hypothetical protein